MTYIEVFFGAILFLFAMIGVVRGFLKELGVTLVVVFLLFVLNQFEPLIDRAVDKLLSIGERLINPSNRLAIKCTVFIFIIAATAFVSYQGETLAYGGTAPRGGQGIALGLLTGFLNGYLISGSIWHYMDEFSYPIKFLGISKEALSKLALDIIPLLPNRFLGQRIIFGQSLFLYFAILLVLLRVVR